MKYSQHSSSQRIAIFSNFLPYPLEHGNQLRFVQLCKWFKQNGNNVKVIYNSQKIPNTIKSNLVNLTSSYASTHDYVKCLPKENIFSWFLGGVFRFFLWRTRHLNPLHAHYAFKKNFYSKNIGKIAKHIQLSWKPDIVLAEYIFMAPVLRHFPDSTLKLIDTHDVFSRKWDNVIQHGIEDPSACSPKQEAYYLNLADIIISIQENEANMLQRLAPQKKVITTGVDFPIKPATAKQNIEPNSILIIASNNPKNIHGVNSFIENCWPMVVSQIPDARLHIVGKVGENITCGNKVGIVHHGWVDDLSKLYHQTSIVLNPVIAGTGLKIKSVEALCHGSALISFQNGVEGITVNFGEQEPFLVAQDHNAFAMKITDLLQDYSKRKSLQKRALSYAQKHFTTNIVYSELATILQEYATNKKFLNNKT